jgi:nuclear pore complex protein Nup107
MAEFTLLREAYLPETILAYIHVLEFSGKRLTRDFLLMCMDLSVEIAKEGSDVLLLFEKTGRMQELVQAFALASKQLLILSSDKKSAGSRSKKLRSKGWTHDLWSIKA